MSKVQYVLFYLSLLNLVCRCPCLVELPQVEDNSIIETEAAIRSTVNQIFSLLKLTKIRERPKLKQYGLVHNYFTSVTLRDYNNLKEIAQRTRVDYKNADNTTHNFTLLINQILNADSFPENEENNANSVGYITGDAANYLQNYLNQLNYFQEIVSNGPRVYVNEKVAKILENINIEDLNITKTGNNNPLDDDTQILENNEFWKPGEDTRRVYKGKHTRIRTFPFMAVIQAFNMFQCAGSIIHSDLVLTAASCLQLAYNNRFYRENPAYLSVRVGSNFYDGGGEVVAILEVFFHPSYSPKTLRNNLAVVRLIRHLKLKKKRVKKIAIDTVPAQLPLNTRGVTIVGWGATSISNIIKNGFENRLSYAVLDVYDLKECQDVYSKEYVTQNNFCAGFITKGSGACNRDVGGPGVAGGVLRGVVSFGSPQCGTPDSPTVFTKVGYYADWIESIMEQDVPRSQKRTTLLKTPWTWSIDMESTTFNSSLHLTPIGGATEIIEPLTFETTTKRSVERQNKKVDMKLFREFLKTMLNSKEIDEYLDQFMSEQHVGRQLINPTTEAFPAEFGTKNYDFEPEMSDYEAEWTTETAHVTLKQESTTHVYEGNETKQAIGAEKELERDIVELINNVDLREILKESVSTATMTTIKQTMTIQNKNKTEMVNKGKKTSKKKSEIKELKRQHKNMKKEPEKKNETQKENKKVTTFLYITGGEKDQDRNNIKIYNKADDGIDDELEYNLSDINQKGQDIVFPTTNEEINDDSVSENTEEVRDSGDVSNINLYYDKNGDINDPLVERREEDKQDRWMDVIDGKDGMTDESSQDNKEKEGMNIDPPIPEILTLPSLLDQFIPPSQTQVNLRFRAIEAENKSESQLEKTKTLFDILNEVIVAETNANATNAFTTGSVGGRDSFQVLRSQDLHASNNQSTLSLL